MQRVSNIPELKDLFEKYFIKGVLTNNYKFAFDYEEPILERTLYFEVIGNNAYIFYKKSNVYNLYFFVNDLSLYPILPSDLPTVIELVYLSNKELNSNLKKYLKNFLFNPLQIRNNMIVSFKNCVLPQYYDKKINIKFVDNSKEKQFVIHLFEKSLNPLTSNLLSEEQINELSDKQKLLCAYYNDELAGAVHFDVRLNIVWLEHISVDAKFRGFGIAKFLMDFFMRITRLSDETRYQLWVVNNNNNAIKLYRSFGFIETRKRTMTLINEKR